MSDFDDPDGTRRQARAVRKKRHWLEDIVSYGKSIVAKLERLTESSFVADADVCDLTYYRLLCVSEAVRNVLQVDPAIVERQPHIPWTAIRALGNILRHEYGGIDPSTIWRTFERGDLAVLIAAAQLELLRLEA